MPKTKAMRRFIPLGTMDEVGESETKSYPLFLSQSRGQIAFYASTEPMDPKNPMGHPPRGFFLDHFSYGTFAVRDGKIHMSRFDYGNGNEPELKAFGSLRTQVELHLRNSVFLPAQTREKLSAFRRGELVSILKNYHKNAETMGKRK